jgi:WD40 repeat protein
MLLRGSGCDSQTATDRGYHASVVAPRSTYQALNHEYPRGLTPTRLELALVSTIRVSLLLSMLLALSACADSSAPLISSPTFTPSSPAVSHVGSREYLYVASDTFIFGGEVSVFTLGHPTAIAIFDEKSYKPSFVTFDRAGNLYVVDGDITVFRPGSTKPFRRIYRGTDRTSRIAFDSSNTLYAANVENNTVTAYLGNGVPVETIRVLTPRALLTDSAGDLYVASYYGNFVNVYPPKRAKAARKLVRGIKGPTSLAFGPGGDLYVANGATGTVAVYSRGSFELRRVIGSGVRDPSVVAFDPRGVLFVACQATGTRKGYIAVFAQGSSSPARFITDAVTDPIALIFDGAGNLYVANQSSFPGAPGSVAVFSPKESHPSRVFTQGLYDPASLAIGSW